jgi:NADPH2:quinone reductase
VGELFGLYLEGKVKPAISRHYPLEKSAEAIIELASRKATGKIVITVP